LLDITRLKNLLKKHTHTQINKTTKRNQPKPTETTRNESMSDSTAAEEVVQRLKALNVQRQSLEWESEAIVSELTTSDKPEVPPMGIDTPLVDSEGYPRSDIDVYRARTLRSRLVAIRNDHKTIMNQIDDQLGQLSILQDDGDKRQHVENEQSARSAAKPKPKFDPKTGKWVVKNWDGSMYV
jgi:Nas2 N_terminal domain